MKRISEYSDSSVSSTFVIAMTMLRTRIDMQASSAGRQLAGAPRGRVDGRAGRRREAVCVQRVEPGERRAAGRRDHLAQLARRQARLAQHACGAADRLERELGRE